MINKFSYCYKTAWKLKKKQKKPVIFFMFAIYVVSISLLFAVMTNR